MMKLFKTFYSVLFVILLTVLSFPAFAQHKKTKLHRSTKDSLRRTILKRDSLLRTFKHSDNSLNELLQKIEVYNSSYKQDSSELLQGFVDTIEINATLPTMEKRMRVMSTLIQNDHSSSLGYLFTIRDLLEHFKDNLDDWQKDLTDDNTMLEKILGDANDFKSDSTMHTVPTDSTLRAKSLSQILAIQKNGNRLIQLFKKT